MTQYIPKDTLVTEIENKRKHAQAIGDIAINSSMQQFFDGMKQGCVDILSFINTLEAKEDVSIVIPYDVRIQYVDRESAIKTHAEDYSWNIESELFQQLTPEQQKLWRKDIEQACISGGYCGLNLKKDNRYDEAKEVDLEKEIERYFKGFGKFASVGIDDCIDIARHFFEIGLKAQYNSISIPNIDNILEENSIDPNSKDAKILKECYYMALEKLKAHKL